MQVGDWVYSYSKGIWQISRIEDVEDVFPDNSIETMVHCKRFLNSSYKKSFSAESCAPGFISPLPTDEINKLNEIIKSKPNWYKEFQEFHKSISSILNLAFYMPGTVDNEKFKKTILQKCNKLNEGLTDVQILKILEEELKMNEQSSIRNFTAQFISKDSEVKNRKMIYRELNFLDF